MSIPAPGTASSIATRAQGAWFTQTLIETDKFLASLGWLKGAPTLQPNQP